MIPHKAGQCLWTRNAQEFAHESHTAGESGLRRLQIRLPNATFSIIYQQRDGQVLKREFATHSWRKSLENCLRSENLKRREVVTQSLPEPAVLFAPRRLTVFRCYL